MLTPVQQLTGLFNFYVGLSALSATGNSANITTALGTAANTAARGGGSVPVQQATTNAQGFVTSGGNKVVIFDSTTKERIKDASQNAVYGRLTFASSVYTVSFFTLVGSTETAYSFASATNIDLLVPYLFEIGLLPADFATRVSQSYVGEDLGVLPGGTTVNTFPEILTVTALNTVNPLTKTPLVPNAVLLVVNGITNSVLTGDFSLGGTGNKTITWIPSVAGHSLLVGAKVLAYYPTLE